MSLDMKRVAFDVHNGDMAVDASDLVLPPATWPRHVAVQTEEGGEYRAFYLLNVERDDDGDVTRACYASLEAYGAFYIYND